MIKQLKSVASILQFMWSGKGPSEMKIKSYYKCISKKSLYGWIIGLSSVVSVVFLPILSLKICHIIEGEYE
jgi:hypothetical protein